MTISNELLDGLLARYKTPEDLIGEGGHLGYAKHEAVANHVDDARGKGKGWGLGACECPRLAAWCPKMPHGGVLMVWNVA